MKTNISFLLLFLTLISLNFSYSQIDSLFVNDSSSAFTMVSGETISWRYKVPVGATTVFDIWLDVNANSLVDSSVDKLRMTFNQTDGGGTGLPDMDGSANGYATFSIPVGFAPGTYLFRFSQGGVSLICVGIITPLASPAHTISGHVTAPPGKSPRYIFMQAKRRGNHYPSFWEGITDSLGNFIIETTSDTAGNPWTVELADQINPFQPAIISPATYTFNLEGNPSGFDFVFLSTAAKVVGYLKDEYGVPISNNNVSVIRFLPDSNIERRTTTNMDGWFEIDFLASDLSEDDYRLASYYTTNTDYNLVGVKIIHGLHIGDSLFINLVSYYVNSSIQGQVLINGLLPGVPITLHGSVNDTAFTFTVSDTNTGYFSLPVSDKLYNYVINPENTSGYYGGMNVLAHPGQTGVIINLLKNASSISGFVFNDLNSNGTPDGGEPGLAGWTVTLSGSETRTTTTNSFGQYVFGNLQPGMYNISEQLQTGWDQTSPVSPSYITVTLGSNDQSNGNNFGNHAKEQYLSIREKWNLLSVPFSVADARTTALFSTAISQAMKFVPEAGYVQDDTLDHGVGYWLKFNEAQSVQIPGSPIMLDSVVVKEGWNLVGSVGSSIRASSVTSIPPGMITSNFYGYEHGYFISDTLRPGMGYWVKVEQDGKLYLSASGVLAGKICIVPIAEPPPTPPNSGGVEAPPQTPARFALEQNYPNPFNPSTVICYKLSVNSHVTIKIFDLLSREVVTLVDGVQSSGAQSVQWDASGLPSGIYLYRLQATSVEDASKVFDEVKKLVIMK